ncbi:MAG: LVIVD repeat-containing protein [Candidatus Acidiferrales bacterium]
MRRNHGALAGSEVLCILAWGLTVFVPASASAQQQTEKKNMELAGYHDLQGRSAYQPVIHRQGERWIAYIGHHGGSQLNTITGKQESNGTSILDVTDPKLPKYLAHIPGEPGTAGRSEAGGAQMVRVCDGSSLPHADKSKVYLLRTFGNSAHEIWDVTNPANPNRLTVIVSGLRDTHKSWWECDTGIAYLVSGLPDWRTRRMAQIYDLSDPAKPVFIRNFGLPGQQPGATGPAPSDLHGPISTGPKSNRVYFAYGPTGGGILQIVDREKLLNGPKEPTDENLLYPQVARLDLPPEAGAHTAFPLLGVEVAEFSKNKNGKVRDFVVISGEAMANECLESRQMVRIVDITTESRPLGVSTWTVPEASGNFCSRGGRFGTHSSNESFTPIYYKRVIFFAHFNAGVRALDVRDPFHPREIGYYIPAVTDKTDKRCVGTGAEERCKVAIQTNNVEVDDRGYIYITDRANTGLHILELTGTAREVAKFP